MPNMFNFMCYINSFLRPNKKWSNLCPMWIVFLRPNKKGQNKMHRLYFTVVFFLSISKFIVYRIHGYENYRVLFNFVCWNNKYLFIYLFIYTK